MIILAAVFVNDFYLVGTGKTMLMDMFYELAPLVKKQRIHFNAFMLGVHDSE